MISFFYVVSSTCNTSVPAFRKCMDASIKKFFWLRAQPLVHPAGPLRRTWKPCLPSPVWAVQTCENHWGRGLASMVDVEDTQRTDLGLLQQLNGQYGAEHRYVATKHLYSDVHVVWTWLQDTDDSLGDLHTLHWSQCFPWACSAPKLPLVHSKRVSITFPADGCVRNFFGFGEEVWRHSFFTFLVSGWW